MASSLATLAMRKPKVLNCGFTQLTNTCFHSRSQFAALGGKRSENNVCSLAGSTPMKNYAQASFLGSVSALGVAACCVLPMMMMLVGFGGSWLAVFGKLAAISYYVLAASTLALVLAWILAYRKGSLSHLKWWLAGSTVLTALAWVVLFNEARINDYLITLM
jgi:mercuric ion transport protein